MGAPNEALPCRCRRQ